MNRSILVHSLWALAAIGTFAIGTQWGGSSADAQAEVDGRRGSRLFGKDNDGRLSALPEASGAGKGVLLKDDADLGAGMMVIALNDARIVELGETALKDPNPLH